MKAGIVKIYAVIYCVLLLLVFGVATGCVQNNVVKSQEVTFEQLFANLEEYDGKHIIIEGFYFGGFEVQVITESLSYSGYAEGHLVPKGQMIWVEGGIPQDIHDSLYIQQMTGPEERYGKVRVTGKFEYGGKYGHVGGYSSQIVPDEVVLISWSPSLQNGLND
jgi:hypothetical protein